ncbi:MAG: LysR family transcriptional regulator [Gammaproteobacteria bacterium]|nr:LysR family transcriptional regulator [Gammaproteobacteria bacterium]
MHLTLRQLQCFSAVARNLSYTRAAEELHLTQPAVSMQIRQLEQQAGLALTEQLGKQVYLTEAGEEVHRYAKSILDQVEEMDDVLDKLKGFSGGRLRIAAISSANYFAPKLLGTFHQRFPDVSVSMDVTNQTSVVKQVIDNEVDMAIMGQPPSQANLEAVAFMDNPLIIVAPPDHRLAVRKRIALKELEKEVFLIREPGSGTRGAMQRFFREQKLKLTTGMEMGSLSGIKQGVQAGLGLGLLPRGAVEVELMLRHLVELKIKGLPIRRHWYVVLQKGKRLSLAAEEFRLLLTDEAVDLLAV